MSRLRKPTVYHLLEVFVDEMEARGQNRKLVRQTIDKTFAEKVSEKTGSQASLGDIQKLADRCLANEWLEQILLGGSKYSYLGLTTTGMGVVRSRQRKEEQLAQRSFSKRVSDYIEDHKGLFIALAAAIGIMGFLVRFFAR